MKITYLELKNYIGLYNGMGLKNIKIDFNDSKNKFIIITGKNGVGKSTLMDSLHPFSDPLIYDKKIIRESKNGYKKIWYTHLGVEYRIHHEYSATKTSHSTKSYIIKITEDGKELDLNPNGNVSSFLETIYTEFGIDPNFLKISKLGNQVASFIEMKASQRKEYMSTLLSEIDVYTKLFKKVNEQARELHSLINNVSEKINKLDSEESINSSLEVIEKKLNRLYNKRDEIMSEIYHEQGVLDTIDPDNSVHELFLELSSKIKELKFKKNNLDIMLGSIDVKNLNELNDRINEININLSSYISKMDGMKNRLRDLKMNLSMYNEMLDEKTITLNNIDSGKDYDELKDIEKTYIKIVEDGNNRFKNFNPKVTRNELLLAYDILERLKNSILAFYQNNMSYVEDSIDIILEGNESIIHDSLNKVSNKILDIERNIRDNENKLIEYKEKLKHKEVLSKRPKECKLDVCSFIEESLKWKDVDKLIEKSLSKLDDLNDEHHKQQNEFNKLTKITLAIENIKDLLRYIKDNSLLLDRLPNNSFYINKTDFLNNIKKYKNYDDINDFSEFIEFLEDYESYKNTKDIKLVNIQNELKVLESNLNVIKNLNKDITLYKNNIAMIKSNIDDINNDIIDYSNKIDELNNLKEKLNTNVGIIKDYEDISKKINECKELYDTKSSTIKVVENARNLIDDYREKLSVIEEEIIPVISQRDKIVFNKKQLKKYNKEKKMLDEYYNEVEIIKDSLSNKKGIPLIFVKIYLQKTRKIANNLLKYAFDGVLMIDEFEVDEKEFKIPCIGKGERNPDVMTASGGERSIISMALSFALIQQNAFKYNILQLDEMDGMLDKDNRKTFLTLLESQIKLMGVEQVFIITHNSAFESYECDVIAFKGYVPDYLVGKNVIFKYAS